MRPRFAFRSVVGVGALALACFASACGGSGDTTGPVEDASAGQDGLGGGDASDGGGARDGHIDQDGDSGSAGDTGSKPDGCTGPGQCDSTHPCPVPRQVCCPPITPAEGCGFCGGDICPA
jgi:hypothetical protein